MTFLAVLWLPVVLSAVLAFVVSAASHMVLPWRRGEWGRIAAAEPLQAALRGLEPGQYMFPASPEPRDQMKREWLERWAAGPAGWITIASPGPINMGRNMGLSVVAYLAVSSLVAYVAWAALGPAPGGATILRVVTTVAFLAYGVGTVFHSIWYHRPWRVWVSDAVDALVLALITGAVFVRFWPR
jgi:hypothetical protein